MAKKSCRGATIKDHSFTKADKQAQHAQVAQAIVDLVTRRPSLADQIWDYGFKPPEAVKAVPENDGWPKNYYRLKQASVSYMMSVLRKCKPEWKERNWTRLRSQPPLRKNDTISAVLRLFYWATATKSDDPIISNRLVCTRVLVERYRQFGKRLHLAVLQDNGWVDWKSTGHFRVERSTTTGLARGIIHISGEEVPLVPSRGVSVHLTSVG